jgi:uncharacterized protein (TIGR03435 family)
MLGPRLVLIVLIPVFLFGQDQRSLAFEAASVKPAMPGALGGRDRDTPTGLDFQNKSLLYYVIYAWRVKDYQIVAPSWMSELKFDILAKAPANPRPKEFAAMLQTLLIERFHLQIHHETRELPGLALIPAKGGLRLTEADPKKPAVPDPDTFRNLRDAMSIPTPGTVRIIPMPDGGLRLVAGRVRMTVIAGNLGNMLGIPVFDQTGATGDYDFVIDASRDDVQNQKAILVDGHAPELPGSDPATPPGISIHESLLKVGLRLESRKMPIDFIVVDHADKTPTEN